MSGRLLARVTTLLMTLALLVPIGGAVAPAQAAAKAGTVKVKVQGLPSGTVTKALLKKPGTKVRISIPGTSRVPAGRYRLVVPTRTAGGAKYYPDRKSTPVRVRKGKSVSVRVVYGTAVSVDSEVLQPGDVGSVGADSLQLSAGVPAPAVGDVLGMGVTAETPEGLLVKVTGVTGRDVTFEEATLRDALPVASFDQEIDLTAEDLRPGSGWHGVKGSRAMATPINKLISCDSGASMEVNGSFSIAPSFQFQADWGWVRLKSASFVGRLTESAQLQASINAAASCSTERIAILSRPVRFRPITFVVAGWPVVLVPELQIYLDGGASVEGAITTSLSQSYGVMAGIKYTRSGGLQPVAGVEKDFSYSPPTANASASVTARVLPEFSVLVYGLAGPSLNLNGGLRFDAQVPRPSGAPWWTLNAFIGAGASLKVPALKIDKRIDDVLHYEWLVAQSEIESGDDLDGDGYSPPEDCNDNDAGINPAAYDRPGDGIDQDCSGADAVLGTGDFQATLMWDNAADLDLHVIEPSGEEIYFGNPGPSATGGLLDYDDNVGCGTPGAVENVYWPDDSAPSGTYQIYVVNYQTCDVVAPPWRVVIRIDGVVVVDQTGADGSMEPIVVEIP